MTSDFQQHQTVMLTQAVDALLVDCCGLYIDGTFGRGGHTRLILDRLCAQGSLLALDRDPEAALVAKHITDARLSFKQVAFADMDKVAEPASVDGILLDIGVSSPQIDNPARGFSFKQDGPLDMRMDPTQGQSAVEFLANADVNEITRVIKDYGEERFAFSIAKAIVARRESQGALNTTAQLAALVASVVKTREAGKDPATRTFQALRIYVNDELGQLEHALQASLNLLKPLGRLVVISFHSLEDRIVKQFMAKHSREVFDRNAPFAPSIALALKDVKRIMPTVQEVAQNPRARSAIMRVATRTDALVNPDNGSPASIRRRHG